MLFASLAMFMVLLSYIFMILLASLCVYLPFLLLTAAMNFNTLVLFLGGIVVAAVMLWSLVPRIDKFEPPGLLLEPASHPQLFTEIQQIASKLGEPLPREVYLIGDPNAWVADRGGLMGIGSRRVMGLGLPLLAALNVSQFRAILAHEFAHYYGGDTSLGPWLHRTQMSMVRTFQNMGSIGQMSLPALVAIFYTVVFKLLHWYWLLFLRAINFVSRKQEYRADELACLVAGQVSLISGLRGVHASALAWPSYWRTEVAPMLSAGRLPAIADGFSQFLIAPQIAEGVQKGLAAQIAEAKVDPYDSHPPLRDRIAAANLLSVDAMAEDHQPASILLTDIDQAELNFLEVANPQMPKNFLQPVSWQESGPVVLIPTWKGSIAAYAEPLAAQLQGETVASIPKALGKVPDVAAIMRDPAGMLLTQEQRIQRARGLVSTAFALALVNHGWNLHSLPGEFYLEKDGHQLQPFQLTLQLSDGKIGNDAWQEMCAKDGIADIELMPAATKPQSEG
ncbi:MAG: M48 family metalloprotease [Acidobacteria bacterium]|nr:M48 family metalloprotease [Acidobacteriota bacterium]